MTQVDGMPDFDREQPRRDRGKPEDGDRSERRDRPERGPRRERGEHPVRGKRGDHRERDGAPGGEKKWDKPKLSQDERKGYGEDTRSRGPKREDDRPSTKQENRKNRDKALGELSDKSANADKPKVEKPKKDYSESKPAGSEQFADESNFIKADEVKKPKKPKKSKTVKFTGLKKKGDGEKTGGAAPRRRPS